MGSHLRLLSANLLNGGADPDRLGLPHDFLSGLVDEIRISSVARYQAGQFKPATRFEPDEQTLLLLHCDRNIGPFAVNAARPAHGLRLGNVRFVPR